MIALWQHQEQIVSDITHSLSTGHRRILCCLPTGGGKTRIAAVVAEEWAGAGGRVYFIADRTAVTAQTVKDFESLLTVRRGRIESEFPEDRSASIQICSLDSMRSRTWWRQDLGLESTLFILDEAHGKTVWGAMGQEIQKGLGQSSSIMLTATPDRLAAKESFLAFENLVLVQGPDRPYDVLQAAGTLVPGRYFQMRAIIETDGVRTVAGEYDQAQLAKAANRAELIQGMLERWQERERGKRTVAFCVDVAHAESVVAAWQAAGYRAAVVIGKTEKDVRQDIFEAFDRGELDLLATCGALTYGWDCKPVEVALLMRPTTSWMLYYQMIGRVLRGSPATGKTDARIYDQTLNVLTHGLVESLERYELRPAGEPVKRVSAESRPRLCPECGAICQRKMEVCWSCEAILGDGQPEKWIEGFVGFVVAPAAREKNKKKPLPIGRRTSKPDVFQQSNISVNSNMPLAIKAIVSRANLTDFPKPYLVGGRNYWIVYEVAEYLGMHKKGTYDELRKEAKTEFIKLGGTAAAEMRRQLTSIGQVTLRHAPTFILISERGLLSAFTRTNTIIGKKLREALVDCLLARMD